MSQSISQDSRRIARNTMYLYCRSILIMAISLYTSRVILDALGVEDYGVYNVVGGVVAMFSAISGALSGAISRYLTFELGKDNLQKLNKVFITSINILLLLAIIVIFFGGAIGIWFINNKMTISTSRIPAANWVLLFSVLSFCINLISIPYNAAIIAHERMNAFAYVSIIEATLKLIVCFIIQNAPCDKLILYAFLLAFISIIIRLIYNVYCKKNFPECKFKLQFDKNLTKEMLGFTGWNFITHGIYIFNTNGVDILINLFFGPILNAARGIVNQIQNAILQFVAGFSMAMMPQITKLYAQEKYDEMNNLICRGAKFSFFLLFLLSDPIIFEIEYILKLWLKTVPEHTETFFKLAIIASMIDRLGDTGATACRATGRIKHYSITLTSLTSLIFPLTWISFKLNFVVESTYIIFIIIYLLTTIVRLFLMKQMIKFQPILFLKKVIVPIIFVVIPAASISYAITNIWQPSFARLIISIITDIAVIVFFSFFIGLDNNEKNKVLDMINKKLNRG